MHVVSGELVVVLLNRVASPFHSVHWCIQFFCAHSSVNSPSSNLTPHLYEQFGVRSKLV